MSTIERDTQMLKAISSHSILKKQKQNIKNDMKNSMDEIFQQDLNKEEKVNGFILRLSCLNSRNIHWF